MKPSNILITEQCTIKLCDFGFARTLNLIGPESANGARRPLSPICFTRYYRPPELIFQNNEYTEKADVWSVGCVVSEIIKQMGVNTGSYADKILFRGSSCYPISPAEDDGTDAKVKQIDSND